MGGRPGAAPGADPYGVYPHTAVSQFPGQAIDNIYLNPPGSLGLVWLLSWLPVPAGYPIWAAAEGLLLCAALAMLVRQDTGRLDALQLVALAASTAAGMTVVFANVYGLMCLLVVGAWVALERHQPTLGGLCMGLALCIKPFLLVWPGLLLLAGRWRPAAVAGAVAAAAAVLSVGLWGTEPWLRWLELAGAQGARVWIPENVSLHAPFARLGLPAAGWVLSLALWSASALWAWRHRPPVVALSAVALAVALLTSPIAWNRYLVFLFPLWFLAPWGRRAYAALVLGAVPFGAVVSAVEAEGTAQVVAYAWQAGFLLLLWHGWDAVRGLPHDPPAKAPATG